VNAEQAAALRAPFPDTDVDLLPKPTRRDAEKGRCRECNGWHGLPAVHLQYVGHAALTARLLDVDPGWTWEPVAFDNRGLPALDELGGLWIRLTVAGVTRLGYGHADGKRGGDAIKEAIGDALRNAAMRFGCALDLWRKSDRRTAVGLPSEREEQSTAEDQPAPPRPATKRQLTALHAALTELGLTGRPDKLVFVSGLVGREITSSSELSTREAAEAIDTVRAQLAEAEGPAPDAPEAG
jgi:hypothetical protein